MPCARITGDHQPCAPPPARSAGRFRDDAVRDRVGVDAVNSGRSPGPAPAGLKTPISHEAWKRGSANRVLEICLHRAQQIDGLFLIELRQFSAHGIGDRARADGAAQYDKDDRGPRILGVRRVDVGFRFRAEVGLFHVADHTDDFRAGWCLQTRSCRAPDDSAGCACRWDSHWGNKNERKIR